MESTGRMGGKIDMMALELEVLEVTVWPKAEVLTLSTTDIWDWVALLCRELSCPVHCLATSLVPTHDLSIVLLQWWQPKMTSEVAKCFQRGQSSPAEHCHLILTSTLWIGVVMDQGSLRSMSGVCGLLPYRLG
jgi:hypothetical protein